MAVAAAACGRAVFLAPSPAAPPSRDAARVRRGAAASSSAPFAPPLLRARRSGAGLRSPPRPPASAIAARAYPRPAPASPLAEQPLEEELVEDLETGRTVRMVRHGRKRQRGTCFAAAVALQEVAAYRRGVALASRGDLIPPPPPPRCNGILATSRALSAFCASSSSWWT